MQYILQLFNERRRLDLFVNEDSQHLSEFFTTLNRKETMMNLFLSTSKKLEDEVGKQSKPGLFGIFSEKKTETDMKKQFTDNYSEDITNFFNTNSLESLASCFFTFYRELPDHLLSNGGIISMHSISVQYLQFLASYKDDFISEEHGFNLYGSDGTGSIPGHNFFLTHSVNYYKALGDPGFQESVETNLKEDMQKAVFSTSLNNNFAISTMAQYVLDNFSLLIEGLREQIKASILKAMEWEYNRPLSAMCKVMLDSKVMDKYLSSGYCIHFMPNDLMMPLALIIKIKHRTRDEPMSEADASIMLSDVASILEQEMKENNVNPSATMEDEEPDLTFEENNWVALWFSVGNVVNYQDAENLV